MNSLTEEEKTFLNIASEGSIPANVSTLLFNYYLKTNSYCGHKYFSTVTVLVPVDAMYFYCRPVCTQMK